MAQAARMTSVSAIGDLDPKMTALHHPSGAEAALCRHSLPYLFLQELNSEGLASSRAVLQLPKALY